MSYDAEALGEIVAEGGLGDIVKEVSIETGKGVVKGLAFSAFPTMLNKFMRLLQEFYKKRDYFIRRYREFAI